MYKYAVKFQRPEDIPVFVNAASQCEGDVDLVSGRVIVDAKSVMGVVAISNFKELEMVVHDEAHPKFLEQVSRVLVS